MPTLYVVATPIGNLSDFSPRAKETLQNVSLIAAEDTTHTIKLLNYFNIKTPMVSYHKYNEAEKTPYLINRMLSENIDIAIVTDAGTPCISDPGYDLINSARQNSIEVIGIPGCCAAVTALSISGFKADTFTFIGFLERNKSEQIEQLKKLDSIEIDNIIIYESPFRILSTLKNIENTINCDVCVCNDITKLHELSICGNIKDVTKQLEESPNAEKGEYVIIIHKHEKEKQELSDTHDISIEAQLVDTMIKQNCTVKDAITNLKNDNPQLSKKEIYSASINLKELFS